LGENTMIVGIEIGGTKLQIVQANTSGLVLNKYQFRVNATEGAAGIRQQIARTIGSFDDKISAIGVGFGGPIDHQTGQILTSNQIDGWAGFNLKNWLENICPSTVVVDNDANVAALGEACQGAGVGYDKLLYVTLGSGVGGGLVINQKIFHGATGGEVEIGHIWLNNKGQTLENLCSGWSVDAQIRAIVQEKPMSYLAKIIGSKSNETQFLSQALDENDTDAHIVFDQLTHNLALGLSYAVHLLHPQIIVLGGGLSLIGERLSQSVSKKLPTFVTPSFHPTPAVVLAQLKEMTVPIGAVTLAKQLLSREL
jgi:glucokinase